MLTAMREMALATATGGFAAGTAGYFVLHTVWSRARGHGDLANSYADELQRMRGVRAPAPSTVRLRPKKMNTDPPQLTCLVPFSYPAAREGSERAGVAAARGGGALVERAVLCLL